MDLGKYCYFDQNKFSPMVFFCLANQRVILIPAKFQLIWATFYEVGTSAGRSVWETMRPPFVIMLEIHM